MSSITEQLKELKKEIRLTVQEASEDCFVYACLGLYQRMVERIFDKGQKTNGKKIGKYSSEYDAKVRAANNRTGSSINLQLTGELRRDFIFEQKDKSFLIGFRTEDGTGIYKYKVFEENKGKLVKKTKTETDAPNSAKRAQELEDRFGIIFEPSEDEIALFYTLLEQCSEK